MSRRGRLNDIVSAIVETGGTDVEVLAARFGVSEATIRRDLKLLEQQRLVTRQRGAAVPNAAFHDMPLSFKTTHNLAEKRRIAATAVDYLAGVRVLGFTGGTTVSEFAVHLLDRDGLTVVTNALNIASNLLANPALRVFVAGGEARSSSQETVGPTAEAFFSDYNLDVAFLGVDGVDAGAGCTTYDPVGARVNKMLHLRANKTVILADATKIGRVALMPVCTLSAVDVLITDKRAPKDAVARIQEQGCEVVLV